MDQIKDQLNLIALEIAGLKDDISATQTQGRLRSLVTRWQLANWNTNELDYEVRALTEVNPMLGHRGVRLGLSFPEIYSMQISAVLEAAAECVKEGDEVRRTGELLSIPCGEPMVEPMRLICLPKM